MTAAVREKDEEPAISLKRTTGVLMRLGFIADRNVKKNKKNVNIDMIYDASYYQK